MSVRSHSHPQKFRRLPIVLQRVVPHPQPARLLLTSRLIKLRGHQRCVGQMGSRRHLHSMGTGPLFTRSIRSNNRQGARQRGAQQAVRAAVLTAAGRWGGKCCPSALALTPRGFITRCSRHTHALRWSQGIQNHHLMRHSDRWVFHRQAGKRASVC